MPERLIVPYKSRRMEWWLALMTVGFGIWLGMPGTAMGTGAYRRLLLWFVECDWAFIFFALGAAHALALYINGSRWWTPFLRAGMLFFTALAYAGISIGFALTNFATTATYTYMAIAIGCSISIYFAVIDCVHALAIRKACGGCRA